MTLAATLGTEVLSLLQILARLLKSSHPEDLRAANKLIKEMVQEVRPGKVGLGGSGWHQGSSGSLSSYRHMELLLQILQQQLLKSPLCDFCNPLAT